MPLGFSSGQPSLLNKQQKGFLSTIKKTEKSVHGDLKDEGLDRIESLYVRPLFPTASDREITRRSDMIYQACKHVLRKAPLTTNIAPSLFINDGFFNSDELSTVWTVPTKKGLNYFNTRQAVEEAAFGYKIDWSVPISVAARTRPVYAGLNFSSHPYGAAPSYGSVVLNMKPSLRQRCTFIASDTFSSKFDLERGGEAAGARARAQMTTDNRIGNLCASMSDFQLKALCEVSQAAYHVTEYPPNYIEAHLHGSVRWDRDLESIRLVASGDAPYTKGLTVKESTFKYLVSTWAKRYNVPATIWTKDVQIERLYP